MHKADYLWFFLMKAHLYVDPNEDRNHITGLDHALRVATLAHEERHRRTKRFYQLHLDYYRTREEVAFVALVHDLARPLSDIYHGEVIAEIVRDVVSENAYQTLRVHGQYQANLIHGTPVDETAPWHNLSKALCDWEEISFAGDWDRLTMSLVEARKLIDRVCE